MAAENFYLPIIIIGAPRSGTNMLRDVLTTLDGVATWPCDEINYVWRHGNASYRSDELPVDRASSAVQRYISKSFLSISKRYSASIVVEKTCANSLRVPFVDKVVPDAKFIFIYRHGLDVVESAKKRWTAKLDVPYLLEKVRFVPIFDIPYYFFRYFWARVYRIFSSERRLSSWGPVLDGMQDILQKRDLNEICALQWERCVNRAEDAFRAMPDEKVYRLSYEDFVADPTAGLENILSFVGYNFAPSDITKAVSNVSSGNIGKGRAVLDSNEVLRLEKLIGATLKRLGYL